MLIVVMMGRRRNDGGGTEIMMVLQGQEGDGDGGDIVVKGVPCLATLILPRRPSLHPTLSLLLSLLRTRSAATVRMMVRSPLVQPLNTHTRLALIPIHSYPNARVRRRKEWW